MQIKKNSTNKLLFFLSIAVLSLFVLGAFIVIQSKKEKQTEEIVPVKKIADATVINTTTLDFEKLIAVDTIHLFKNDELHVFAIEEDKLPKIAFLYHQEPKDREKTDLFFIHVYLKDTLLTKEPFVNFTYADTKPPIKIDNSRGSYYLYTKALESKLFENNVIPFEEIDYINLGRFTSEKGKSLKAGSLATPPHKIIKNLSTLDQELLDKLTEESNIITITVTAKANDFDKVRKKRDKALISGILLLDDDDIIDGTIAIDGQEKIKTNFRLKGDWTDHLNGENQWSYRFILKDQQTLLGMRKFSIQHPKTRNYQWEWLFNKVIKSEAIIGLRYRFVNFKQQILHKDRIEHIDNGLMALEESFDKILIENNKKREGLIIGFDESLLWQDRKQVSDLGFETLAASANSSLMENAKIKVYNEGKVLSDPKLKKQFLVARDLLDGLRLGNYKVSEVFDIDKLTTFTALSNLFGGAHGLVWHNLRIYYNPITNKLEPIAFDSNSGDKIEGIIDYPFAENDSIYTYKLAEKLKKVSSQEYIDNFLSTYGADLNFLSSELNNAYPFYAFKIKTLEYNSNFIKKQIYPSDIITADLIDHADRTLTLEVNNTADFPVSVTELYHEDGKKLDNTSDFIAHLKPYERKVVVVKLKKAFDNAFVSKKNKKGGFNYPKDVEKLRIVAQINGVNIPTTFQIGAYGRNQKLDESIATYKKNHAVNYKEFDFVRIEKDTTQITFLKGKYNLATTIKIPKNKTVTIEPGFELNLMNNASLLSKATFIAKGTKEQPIIFSSLDSTGGGIFIDNTHSTSFIAYCVFDNLSNPTNDLWEVSGAVNFHESDVFISNTTFKNNRCEDALNIIRSNFEMNTSRFENTFSDAFDGDFVTGAITNTQFFNAGNDGIDVSGSTITLKNIMIDNPSDKAISGGEASTIKGNNISVVNGEIGIVSKDLSSVNLSNVRITNTRLGFSAFQKKSEYGKASITIEGLDQVNNEEKFLIEVGCTLVINGVAVQTVSNSVIEKMYGGEYGKSSK